MNNNAGNDNGCHKSILMQVLQLSMVQKEFSSEVGVLRI